MALAAKFNIFLGDEINEIADKAAAKIQRTLESRMFWLGVGVEKRLFKYIANYAVGHVNPPRSIDGIPVFGGVKWAPLTPAYAKRKRPQVRNKKFLNFGILRTYLKGIDDARRFYGNPYASMERKGDTLEATYSSMFNNSRSYFPGKIGYKLGYNNIKRPIIEPMEDFLWKKFLIGLDGFIAKYSKEHIDV